MLYRRFQTAGGQFLDALFTTDGTEFGAPADAQAADLAVAYGSGALTAVEGETDPWDGVSVLVTAPVVDPPGPISPPVSVKNQQIADALTTISADATLTQATRDAIAAIAGHVTGP